MLKKYLACFLTIFCLLSFITLPLRASGAALNIAPLVDPSIASGTRGFGPESICDFVNLAVRAGDLLIAISGALAVAMFIYGGFWMLTAYGNKERIKKGKDAMIATVFGIFIVLLAWTLVNTIFLGLYGGTPDTSFKDITGSKDWSVCPTTIKLK